MKKKITTLFLALSLVLTAITGCNANPSKDNNVNSDIQNHSISFTDDDGRKIVLDKPAQRIISLYSAHTENLYEIGAGDKLIGASKTSIYPPEANNLPQFDYKSDPEKVIAANPDVVLIRPFITKKSPEFVSAIENAGIKVVSLYSKSFDEFDTYITNLASVVGTKDLATQKLEEFHQNIDNIKNITQNIKDKKNVFFESTEENLRTVTPTSMTGKAIEVAGGINVASDAKAVSETSSIAPFGVENVLALADKIDVYVSQRGAMNSGGNEHSISIRPGFNTIKAIKNGKILLINEKIISSPTFRYYKGISELARFMYPETIDNLDTYKTNSNANKKDFANIIVKSKHIPIYVVSSSRYYSSKHNGHVYGMFEDLTWENKDFDAVETAVSLGAISYNKTADKELFNPEEIITRDELAKAVFILGEYKNNDKHTPISDLSDSVNQNIVQTLVDNGVFELNNGKFEPQKPVTQNEIVSALSM